MAICRRHIIAGAVLCAAGALTSPRIEAQSFDCKKASTVVERAICTDKTVGALDQQLADAIKNLLIEHPDWKRQLVLTERHWLQYRDAQCEGIATDSGKMSDCLRDQYTTRLAVLRSANPLAPPVAPVTSSFTFEFLKSAQGALVPAAVGINDADEVACVIDLNGTLNSGRTIIWKDGSVTDIQSPPKGQFLASSINRVGVIAGELVTVPGAFGGEHAAVWNTGTLTDLDAAESRKDYSSRATALNTKGQVVGWSIPSPTATLWDNGKVVDLGALLKRSGYSEAHAINDAGDIVGRLDTLTGRRGSYAVLWHGATVKFLRTLGGLSSSAEGINDGSQIVGWSNTSDATTGAEAFNGAADATLWDGKAVVDLGKLSGFLRTAAHSINNHAQIVGSADNPQVGPGPYTAQDHHAVYWDSSRNIIDLNQYVPEGFSESGWILTEAVGINDDGVIVGNAYNWLTNLDSAFMLRPAKP